MPHLIEVLKFYNQYLDFYSIVEDKYLAIQGGVCLAAARDEIKLGYSTTIWVHLQSK
jgi:hypothetical protein